MKKKLIGVAVVAAMAVTAGWNYNQSQNEVGMSDLALLANMEALASGETDSYDCPRGSVECARIIVGNTVHIFTQP